MSTHDPFGICSDGPLEPDGRNGPCINGFTEYAVKSPSDLLIIDLQGS